MGLKIPVQKKNSPSCYQCCEDQFLLYDLISFPFKALQFAYCDNFTIRWTLNTRTCIYTKTVKLILSFPL